MHATFVAKLRDRLLCPLPGEAAQLKMSPPLRQQYLNMLRGQRVCPRRGGVLILLYPHRGSMHTVLMVRSEYEGVHSAQVSFPGGKKEEQDANITVTALREAGEETGINPSGVDVLGHLTELYIPASNFQVQPVIGSMLVRPVFIPKEDEVKALIEISLEELGDMSRIKSKRIRMSNGTELETPFYDIQGHTVWGATAMIISEFLQIIHTMQD